jgi:hypothetical protein
MSLPRDFGDAATRLRSARQRHHRTAGEGWGGAVAPPQPGYCSVDSANSAS